MTFIITKEGEKFCTGCGRIKHLEEFSKGQGWCKECKQSVFKEYYKNNKTKFQQTLKENYEKRKKELMCECGSVVYNVSLKSHLNSKIHLKNLLDKQTV